MPDSRITALQPACAITGGRIAILGSDFPVGLHLPVVRIGTNPARVLFASSQQLDVLVSTDESGSLPVQVDGVSNTAVAQVGARLATGLHQVDSPVFDGAGNLFLTYSGTRGQQVPVSIFRVVPNGTRESFSSTITNPTSMAVSPDGRLFVSSRFEGAVYQIADDGSAEVFAADLGIACGLAFTPDGMLLVGDRSGTVFEVSRKGQARIFATLPSSVAAFHLAMGADGLYVTAPTLSARDAIYRITFSGDVSVYHSGFGRPQGIGFSPDGTLHVIEALAGISGLYRLPAGAEPELIVSGQQLVGFAFAPGGDLIVCSSDTAYRLPPAH
jgi:sugar lactone lactonase YvrE